MYETTAEAKIGLGEGQVERCKFESTVSSDYGTFRNCVFQGGIDVPVVGDLAGSNNLNYNVLNSEIHANESGIAFRSARDSDSSVIFNSTIRGQIDIPDGIYKEYWVGNRFESETEYCVDGAAPTLLAGNAFVNGGIRVDTNASLTVDGMGNYYGRWDGARDRDDDGISELPKPIPGDAELTDQRPLMSAELSTYPLPDANV
jgi:hypothetical protein